MPRKSIFKNKQKVEPKTEEIVDAPVEDVKVIALKKKERKQRKKRTKKVEPTVEEPVEEAKKDIYDDIVSFGSEIMGSTVTDDFCYEAKPVKQSKSMFNKLASKLSLTKKVEPKQELVKEVNDEPLPEPIKANKPTKDSIMAKLAALQASRSVVIQPKEKKPVVKSTPVMKELVITSDEKKIEQLKEIVEPKSTSTQPINYRKTYKLFFDLEKETENCEIVWNSDRHEKLTLYKMSFNKNKKSLECSYFCGTKWTTNKRLTLKQSDNVITFKPGCPVMPLQIKGLISTVVKRRNPTVAINTVSHNMKSLRIV